MAEVDFVSLHEALTNLYYKQKAISKTDFTIAHTAIWLYLEMKKIQVGLMPDPGNTEETSTRVSEIQQILQSNSSVLKNIWRQIKLTDPSTLVV